MELVDGEWKFEATMVQSAGSERTVNPSSIPGFLTKKIPEGCDLKGVSVNQGWIGANVASLPILNLKCPEDCRDACFKHQRNFWRLTEGRTERVLV